ncbi:transposase [Maioricimonas sp. JC845]|uniref:integrase core domain-containing protein n=1 Tax=Maioricimonas sp. JC845 TaxID=3232138 RepID=UPI00345AA54D
MSRRAVPGKQGPTADRQGGSRFGPRQLQTAESFHSKFRDEFLAMEEFENVPSARRLTARYQQEYNTVRPHSSLGHVTPAAFARECAAASVRPPASLRQQHTESPVQLS